MRAALGISGLGSPYQVAWGLCSHPSSAGHHIVVMAALLLFKGLQRSSFIMGLTALLRKLKRHWAIPLSHDSGRNLRI